MIIYFDFTLFNSTVFPDVDDNLKFGKLSFSMPFIFYCVYKEIYFYLV